MPGQTPFGDSIAALSSGRLPSAVAVVRLSGPQTRAVLDSICGDISAPRRLLLRRLTARDGQRLDQGLVAFFPAPGSFTGEDCAEFHIHGGKAVVAAVLEELCGFEGVRMAEAGEFTRRAFLNGKLDLASAEGLADLIAAETEAQRRFAVANSTGRQAELYAAWRGRVIENAALLEAELDFADESDVPGSISERAWPGLIRLAGDIDAHIAGYRKAEMIRDGYKVVILGAPNAGKSSLLNYLAGREAAIVTPEPGTTRDVLDVVLDLGGNKVTVSDTAGLREGAGKIERMGMERALARAAGADLVLHLKDVTTGSQDGFAPPGDARCLSIGTKADLAPGHAVGSEFDHVVSTRTGAGVDGLLEALAEAAAFAITRFDDVVPSRARHVELLRAAAAHLRRSCEMEEAGLELRAEELRLAGHALGRISGRIDVEDLLETVFSTFCIGK